MQNDYLHTQMRSEQDAKVHVLNKFVIPGVRILSPTVKPFSEKRELCPAHRLSFLIVPSEHTPKNK